MSTFARLLPDSLLVRSYCYAKGIPFEMLAQYTAENFYRLFSRAKQYAPESA